MITSHQITHLFSQLSSKLVVFSKFTTVYQTALIIAIDKVAFMYATKPFVSVGIVSTLTADH